MSAKDAAPIEEHLDLQRDVLRVIRGIASRGQFVSHSRLVEGLTAAGLAPALEKAGMHPPFTSHPLVAAVMVVDRAIAQHTRTVLAADPLATIEDLEVVILQSLQRLAGYAVPERFIDIGVGPLLYAPLISSMFEVPDAASCPTPVSLPFHLILRTRLAMPDSDWRSVCDYVADEMDVPRNSLIRPRRPPPDVFLASLTRTAAAASKLRASAAVVKILAKAKKSKLQSASVGGMECVPSTPKPGTLVTSGFKKKQVVGGVAKPGEESDSCSTLPIVASMNGSGASIDSCCVAYAEVVNGGTTSGSSLPSTSEGRVDGDTLSIAKAALAALNDVPVLADVAAVTAWPLTFGPLLGGAPLQSFISGTQIAAAAAAAGEPPSLRILLGSHDSSCIRLPAAAEATRAALLRSVAARSARGAAAVVTAIACFGWADETDAGAEPLAFSAAANMQQAASGLAAAVAESVRLVGPGAQFGTAGRLFLVLLLASIPSSVLAAVGAHAVLPLLLPQLNDAEASFAAADDAARQLDSLVEAAEVAQAFTETAGTIAPVRMAVASALGYLLALGPAHLHPTRREFVVPLHRRLLVADRMNRENPLTLVASPIGTPIMPPAGSRKAADEDCVVAGSACVASRGLPAAAESAAAARTAATAADFPADKILLKQGDAKKPFATATDEATTTTLRALAEGSKRYAQNEEVLLQQSRNASLAPAPADSAASSGSCLLALAAGETARVERLAGKITAGKTPAADIQIPPGALHHQVFVSGSPPLPDAAHPPRHHGAQAFLPHPHQRYLFQQQQQQMFAQHAMYAPHHMYSQPPPFFPPWAVMGASGNSSFPLPPLPAALLASPPPPLPPPPRPASQVALQLLPDAKIGGKPVATNQAIPAPTSTGGGSTDLPPWGEPVPSSAWGAYAPPFWAPSGTESDAHNSHAPDDRTPSLHNHPPVADFQRQQQPPHGAGVGIASVADAGSDAIPATASATQKKPSSTFTAAAVKILKACPQWSCEPSVLAERMRQVVADHVWPTGKFEASIFAALPNAIITFSGVRRYVTLQKLPPAGSASRSAPVGAQIPAAGSTTATSTECSDQAVAALKEKTGAGLTCIVSNEGNAGGSSLAVGGSALLPAHHYARDTVAVGTHSTGSIAADTCAETSAPVSGAFIVATTSNAALAAVPPTNYSAHFISAVVNALRSEPGCAMDPGALGVLLKKTLPPSAWPQGKFNEAVLAAVPSVVLQGGGDAGVPMLFVLVENRNLAVIGKRSTPSTVGSAASVSGALLTGERLKRSPGPAFFAADIATTTQTGTASASLERIDYHSITDTAAGKRPSLPAAGSTTIVSRATDCASSSPGPAFFTTNIAGTAPAASAGDACVQNKKSAVGSAHAPSTGLARQVGRVKFRPLQQKVAEVLLAAPRGLSKRDLMGFLPHRFQQVLGCGRNFEEIVLAMPGVRQVNARYFFAASNEATMQQAVLASASLQHPTAALAAESAAAVDASSATAATNTSLAANAAGTPLLPGVLLPGGGSGWRDSEGAAAAEEEGWGGSAFATLAGGGAGDDAASRRPATGCELSAEEREEELRWGRAIGVDQFDSGSDLADAAAVAEGEQWQTGSFLQAWQRAPIASDKAWASAADGFVEGDDGGGGSGCSGASVDWPESSAGSTFGVADTGESFLGGIGSLLRCEAGAASADSALGAAEAAAAEAAAAEAAAAAAARLAQVHRDAAAAAPGAETYPWDDSASRVSEAATALPAPLPTQSSFADAASSSSVGAAAAPSVDASNHCQEHPEPSDPANEPVDPACSSA